MRRNSCSPILAILVLAISWPTEGSDYGVQAGDQFLTMSLGVGIPQGDATDELALDPGLAIGVRYLYHVRSWWGLGLSVDRVGFEGGQDVVGPGYQDHRTSEADATTVAFVVRFVFNPASRTRFGAAIVRGYSFIDVREDYVFEQGTFRDAGGVYAESSRGMGELVLELEHALTERWCLRGEVATRTYSSDLHQLTVALSSAIRF